MKTSELCRITETEARSMLEKIRWPIGPVCPSCGSLDDQVRLAGKSTRPGLLKCRGCKRQYTVTVGTVFERSHIKLSKWVYAIARMCASKKGISAHQLHRELGVSYETAWFMCHRVRLAMSESFQLSGTVEVDETYVGGKPRKGTGIHKRGRGTKKTPVLVLVERNGRSHARVIADITANTLQSAIKAQVSKESTIATDELQSYNGIGNAFKGGHKVVNHKTGQYTSINGGSTNTAESWNSLLKRGIYGTFHHISKEHLQRYCNEFSFRWDRRKDEDEERVIAAIFMAEGKRLMYKEAKSS